MAVREAVREGGCHHPHVINISIRAVYFRPIHPMDRIVSVFYRLRSARKLSALIGHWRMQALTEESARSRSSNRDFPLRWGLSMRPLNSADDSSYQAAQDARPATCAWPGSKKAQQLLTMSPVGHLHVCLMSTPQRIVRPSISPSVCLCCCSVSNSPLN